MTGQGQTMVEVGSPSQRPGWSVIWGPIPTTVATAESEISEEKDPGRIAPTFCLSQSSQEDEEIEDREESSSGQRQVYVAQNKSVTKGIRGRLGHEVKEIGSQFREEEEEERQISQKSH